MTDRRGDLAPFFPLPFFFPPPLDFFLYIAAVVEIVIMELDEEAINLAPAVRGVFFPPPFFLFFF